MIAALVLLPDGTHETLDHVPSLKELQTSIGGFIEMIPATIVECTAYANEEGVSLQLPQNSWRKKLIKFGFYIPFSLHGTVVVLGANKENGDDCALDEEIAKKLLE